MTGRGWFLAAALVVVAAVVLLAVPRLEGDAPEIGEISPIVLSTSPRSVAVEFRDGGAGLRAIAVRLVHPGGERTLLERGFRGTWLGGGAPGTDRARVEISLDPKELGLPDGTARLVVEARDWSWRHGLAGNQSRREAELTVDTVPPRIRVESALTYVRRGGAAAAVYRLDEPAESEGVRVADAFFPGYPLGGGDQRIAFFAIPVDAPKSPEVQVVARDAAGNESAVRFPAEVMERDFAETAVALPSSFLENVVPRLARSEGVDSSDAVAAFRQINTDVRKRDEEQIREIALHSSPERYWEGAFLQLPNSKVTSRFAERRRYQIGGQTVSRARHYGYDLASTSGAPVAASNAGVVLFAGELGIYGNCVLLDHGQGITSLYGHLSSLDVAKGDRVRKGQRLGLTGSTGLAGGDHLHFAILVGGRYVDPLEWWDPEWVRSHVETRLASSDD